MKKYFTLAAIFFTIFLDFFNLGLIYPIFTSLIFEGNGGLVSVSTSDFYKNVCFGLLISSFPFGQFLGAPIIGQLSDRSGRRKLLILSLIGTVATLLICGLGVLFSSLFILLLGRFAGGLMAGNMTLAYASLSDFSTQEEKVKNFALIPLATGLGFAFGPFFAGTLANPEFHALAGPALPFFLAAFLALVNLGLVVWKFPETSTPKKETKGYLSSFSSLGRAFRQPSIRPYLFILFLMVSSNFLFVQFVGPFAIDRLHIGVTEVGYLYANIGIAVALGHLFLTRRLADHFSSEKALMGSLLCLGVLLIGLLFSHGIISLHILTFCIMLACAVAYTNSMALVSNQAPSESQGEIMGVAVSIQSCSEFLPAVLFGFVASIAQGIPLAAAALFAALAYLILARASSIYFKQRISKSGK